MHKQRILLIDDGRTQALLLAQALVEANYDVVARLGWRDDLAHKARKIAHDILIMEVAEVTAVTVTTLEQMTANRLRPVVIFTDKCTDKLAAKAVNAGVTALVIQGFREDRVRSVLEVAVARYEFNRDLLLEVEKAKTDLAERKIIDRAKGLIMQQRNISEDDAYKSMRKLAMDRNQKMVEIARSIIEVSELLMQQQAS